MHLKFNIGRGGLVDLLYFAGAAAISAGAAMLAIPAGLMAGGAFLILAAVLIDRGGEEYHRYPSAVLSVRLGAHQQHPQILAALSEVHGVTMIDEI